MPSFNKNLLAAHSASTLPEQRFVSPSPCPGNSLEGDRVKQRGTWGPETVRQEVSMNKDQRSDMLRVCGRVASGV